MTAWIACNMRQRGCAGTRDVTIESLSNNREQTNHLRDINTRNASAGIVLSGLQSAARLSKDGLWRREAARAMGLFRVSDVRRVRLSRSHATTSRRLIVFVDSVNPRPHAGFVGRVEHDP